MKKAIITGLFGQDGSYLCELLNEKNYEIHGIVREPLSNNSKTNENHLLSKSINPILHYCDLYKYNEVENIIREVMPDEIYHLAAKHYSSELSTEENDRTLYNSNVSATFNILAAANCCQQKAKIILAGSCLMFDGSNVYPQNDDTSYETISYYGLAKITENQLAKFYRNMGMSVSMAILYNHESPRRSSNFVTKKIVESLVQIYKGQRESFELGNLESLKDWGYAKDYANGMLLMAQQDNPMDYVLATGVPRKMSDFVDAAASELGIYNWRQYVNINPSLIKRNMDAVLVGDASHARNHLAWGHSIDFYQLVSLMVRSEISGSLE